MADNVAITAGTGTTIAADEVVDGTFGTAKVQYMKVMDGTPDGTNKLKVNSDGGMLVAGTQPTGTSTAWTSATAVNTALTQTVTGYNTVSYAVTTTTTLTAGAITFEVFEPLTNAWYPLQAARINSYNTESVFTLSPSTNQAWSTSVDGFTQTRIRLSTAITGTATVTVSISPQTFAIEPIVSVGQATASSLQTTAMQPNVFSTVNSTTTTLAANAVFTGVGEDMTNYRTITIWIESDVISAVNGVVFQFSSDNVNWATWSTNSLTGSPSTFVGTVAAKYFRVSYTNGASAQTSFRLQTIYSPSYYAGQFFDTSKDAIIATTTEMSTRNKPYTFNGTTWDRQRSATGAAGTTGTGVQAAGILGFDGTNYQRIKTTTAGAVNIGTATTGGATTFTLISAATTNATSVKATAGTVYGIQASNTGAAVAFLKIYNLAAAPTVGTSVAVKTLIIPAGGSITVPIPVVGLAFGTGIALAITGVATTADTTAVAAAQVVVNLDYV